MKKLKETKNVNPKHYSAFKISPIDVIKEYGFGFTLGNAIKYILRAKNKNGQEDLLKGTWYLIYELTGDKQYTQAVMDQVSNKCLEMNKKEGN